MNYAGFGSRFGAVVIDGLILGALGNILLGFSFLALGLSEGSPLIAYFIGLSLLYFIMSIGACVYCLPKYMGTPGKLICAIEVRDKASGHPVSHASALVRALGFLLSYLTLCFGFLISLLTPKRQALHDIMAGTVVVRTPAKKSGFWLWFVGLILVFLISQSLMMFLVFGGPDFNGGKDGEEISEKKTDMTTPFTGKKEVVTLKPFPDFNGYSVNKTFFDKKGPFALYGYYGGKVPGVYNGKKVEHEALKMAVYTPRFHNRMSMEDLIPPPTIYLAHVIDGKGQRLSTNTDKYIKINLIPSLEKFPEKSGMNAQGGVRLKYGGKYNDIFYIKGVLYAKIPQKVLKLNFTTSDLGVKYQIDSNSVFEIQKIDNTKRGNELYKINITSPSEVTFAAHFEGVNNRIRTRNQIARSSKKLPDGKTTYSYDYEVFGNVEKVVISVPFDFKSESYPFMFRKYKKTKSNDNNRTRKVIVRDKSSGLIDYKNSQTEKNEAEKKPNQLELFNKYLKMAKEGDAEAQYQVSIMFKRGRVVKRNGAAARIWLKKAAEQGHSKAKKALNGF